MRARAGRFSSAGFLAPNEKEQSAMTINSRVVRRFVSLVRAPFKTWLMEPIPARMEVLTSFEMVVVLGGCVFVFAFDGKQLVADL